MVKNNSRNNNNKGRVKAPTPVKGKQNPSTKSILKVLGTAVGGMAGPRGAMLGRMAGSGISKIIGMGDYQVKSNSIEVTGGALGGEVPHFGREDNSTRVRHREFITDIAVPANANVFNNTAYVINPSNALLFPWLAKFAENYQQYRVHGMVMYFKTTTSDYAANGALGKIAMATNYNVRDSAYASMIELENAEFSVSGKPSLSRVHPIECAPNNGLPLVRYVRDTQYDATGGDDRLYDVGKFQFATQGLPGTTGNVLGELWVSYDIEFFKPIVGRAAAAVAYEPVSLPIFNTLGGNGTHSIYQVEKTTLSGPEFTVLTTAEKWDKLHKPDTFVRVAPLVVDSALVCRSLNRPTPDPNPAAYTYPAYWTNPTSPDVTAKRELRITRPGIWYMHMKLDVARGETVASTPATAAISSAAITAPSGNTIFALPAVHVRALNSNGTPNTLGEIQMLSTNANFAYCRNTKENVYSTGTVGNRYEAYFYREGAGWILIMWVPDELVSDNKSVAVRFQTPNETATGQGGAFLWDGDTQLFASDFTNGVSFEVGVVTVTQQTYYRPVTAGLTRDDKNGLNGNLDGILALLPKLRDCGLLTDEQISLIK